LWVGYFKKASGKKSITWTQSVDEALCFGWIDGLRKRIDEKSYQIRFTPRKAKSIWSDVNIKRIRELTELGLMTLSGLEVFEERDQKKSMKYSYENKDQKLDSEYGRVFKTNKTAWSYFQSQAPSYQKSAIWWVMNASKEETQLIRLKTLIEDSDNGKKIAYLHRKK